MGLFQNQNEYSRHQHEFCDEPEEPDQHLRIGNDRMSINSPAKRPAIKFPKASDINQIPIICPTNR